MFQETPQVTFVNGGVRTMKGCDIVIHPVSAVSPPNDFEHEQYYVHQDQIDHN